MKRLDQLTVTRFIAALSVILFHSGGIFPFNLNPLAQLFTSGQIAVNYFFVLSGFVMCLAYFRPAKKLDIAGYYAARFSRVYPVYLLSFLLVCVYYIDLMGKMKSQKILASLFLVQAWNPKYALSFNYVSWSLSVEAFLYAVFPFLLIFLFARLPVRKLIWVSVIFWGTGIITHTILLEAFLPEALNILYYNPLVYLSGFILGCVAGVWYLQVNKADIKQQVNLLLFFIGLALLMVLLIFQEPLARLPAFATLGTGLLAPVFALIILTLALDTTLLSRILSDKRLVLLGDSSYALFILNVPIRWFVERAIAGLKLDVSYTVFYYIFIPIMILGSIFVHQKFERPARNWLLANRRMLGLFALDAIFISLAVGFAYLVRLGAAGLDVNNWRLFTFTLRIAIPLVMAFLFLFRSYQPDIMSVSGMALARQMVAPILLSGSLLSGAVYRASQNEILVNSSKSALALCFVTLFCFTWLSRFLFSRWAVRPQI